LQALKPLAHLPGAVREALMSKPQVWTWEPNSNSGKPLFALCQKGVAFDYHYINMTDFEHHTPEYLARNPAGTLPTMEHNGKVFTESTPMCEYIDDTWPDQGPRMVPRAPEDRYRMRVVGRQITAYAGALSVIGWHNFVGPWPAPRPRRSATGSSPASPPRSAGSPGRRR
jgi:glutathione S-transferase/GST-like protein